MKKADLVAQIAEKSGLSKADAERALKGFTEAVVEALQNGDEVPLQGLGKFEVRERAARKGINPATKEQIDIPASKVPAFKASSSLKALLKK
ncbi:HU family DNA-binding protein [Intestinibaculum porci]|jgi:DNA-binding protein HU-beta|uniref:Transcriptional regulator n=1 Tax=Intestinibaculum porci TaxID=2487118 RepID=A0A3G9JXH7_9FIRM|nr:HU family DNA-binding protein [Intestinibaculum porci]MDD6349517.1 HU family DNA-binding protein [Intestinibaculum porci]MDD6422489.1 HU family DNA-binding protein [Intestinibaculum porci]BBH27504.1 transcriptional regulator [Intestinibaculum porci]